MEVVEEEPPKNPSNAQGKSKAPETPAEDDSVTEPDDSEEEDAKPTILKGGKTKAAQISPTKRAAVANSDSDADPPSPAKKTKVTTKKTVAASESEPEENASPKKKAPPVRQPVRRAGKKW